MPEMSARSHEYQFFCQPRMGDQETDELLRRFCDKQACEAMEMLAHINKAKAEGIKARVLAFIQSQRRPLSYAGYKELVAAAEAPPGAIAFARRANLHDELDLGDLDGI